MITKSDLKHLDNILSFLQEAKMEMGLKEGAEVFNSWIWLSQLKNKIENPEPPIFKPVETSLKKVTKKVGKK